MALEIRPAAQTEMTAFARVAQKSLTLPAEVAPPEALAAIQPDWTLCAFENGELATTYAWWPLTMRFGKNACPVAGITFVGTHPVFRRKGHLRQIISRHFEQMHEQGAQPIAALHASRTAIYQRYGYAVVSWRNAYRFNPRDLVFVRGPALSNHQYGLRDRDGDPKETLKGLYRRFCRDRTGYLHRSRGFWENGVLAPPPRDGVLFQIVYEENNEPLGYVIYTVQPVKGARGRLMHKVMIRDLVWITPRACRALWGHFASMDLAETIEWMDVPPDDPLPYLVSEPAALGVEIRDGFMARIVDVPGALARRQYGAEGRICFELEDPLCPWNRGIWQMEASGNGAVVSTSSRKPEIRMSVDTLAMLVFGHLAPSRAAKTGLLEVISPEVLPVWDQMMQMPFAPFCPDFF